MRSKSNIDCNSALLIIVLAFGAPSCTTINSDYEHQATQQPTDEEQTIDIAGWLFYFIYPFFYH
jgi:hypothetical protein